jgi:uncharacterized protein
MAWGNATRTQLPDGREHWQHGPIDLVIEAWGEPRAVALAHELAWARFQTVLVELVAELPLLRTPAQHATLKGEIARAMQVACMPYVPLFITSMAAVAGAVADTLITFYQCVPGVTKAYVNNGGDIALHVTDAKMLRLGVVGNAYAPSGDGVIEIHAAHPTRGVATSGWRGRSQSLGIADAVTVLARTAAQADAAATMIANAVNVEDHAITRAPANSMRDDADLGDRLVTTDVKILSDSARRSSLHAGLQAAIGYKKAGLIHGAALLLQGEWRTVSH